MSDVARWWESRGYSIEDEKSRFSGCGLDFALDVQLLEEQETVVFNGKLRYGDERIDATILYPAGYASGEQPSVYAPDLPLDDHKRPGDGLICLDQSVFGEKAPLSGAEAVQSAEELWRLSVEDPERLRALSPVTPEPMAAWFVYEQNSAVYLLDVEVPGATEGWFRLDLHGVVPMRGGLGAWGLGLNGDGEPLDVPGANRNFTGRESLPGFWRRVDELPRIFSAAEILAWARAEHGDLIAHAARVEQAHRELTGQPRPVLVAFVFPDRGPVWDATHDAWVVIRIDPDGPPALPRPIELDREDFWVRQPQLRPLSEKKVVVLGVGALGSQIADLLARAGIGTLMLIDPDTVSAGNTIRHALHLGHVAYQKAQALQIELSRANPFSEIGSLTWRFGNSTSGPPASAEDAETYRENDDLVAEQLASADLIVEASTVTATGFLVSRVADESGVPVVHAAVSAGAWGGRLLLQRHGSSGCLECLARHQEDEDGVVPPWAENPDEDPVVEKGCGQTTFTGPGFELASTAAAGARIVVQALLEGGGYPGPDFDLATWEFRDLTTARPAATYADLPRHSSCDSCTD